MNITPRAWWAPTHYRITRTVRRASRRTGARLLGLDFADCAWIVGLQRGSILPEIYVTGAGAIVPGPRGGSACRKVTFLDVR